MTIEVDGGHGAKSAFAHPTAQFSNNVTVIASEAKQSSAAREELDCFVASLLAMTLR
jgi:hypothetical protein